MNACGTLRRRPSSGCMWIWACGCSTDHFLICTRGIMMIGQRTNKHFRFSFMHRGVMSDERDSYGLCLWSWNIIVYYGFFFIQFVHLVRRILKEGFSCFGAYVSHVGNVQFYAAPSENVGIHVFFFLFFALACRWWWKNEQQQKKKLVHLFKLLHRHLPGRDGVAIENWK